MAAQPANDSIGSLIGYIRVSSDGQQDGLSLVEQARLIQDYCTRSGYNLLAIFSDAESGESIAGRDGFIAAYKMVTNKDDAADGLVVLNFDRYSRIRS